MTAVRAASAVAVMAVIAAALGGCSSTKSAKPPTASQQTSVPGCDMPLDTPPGRILDLSIAQEFFGEHLFVDPSPTFTIITQGKVTNSTDFNQWWDKYEGDRSLELGGKTMADWETELMATVFPNSAAVYSSYCSGWRFSTYLRQHPPGLSTRTSTGASSTTS